MSPQDNKLLPKRPEWFKWFGDRYMSDVLHWDADQRGWYHWLLVWSAVQGQPIGYLPSDEEELKSIAGFNSNTFSSVFSALASTPDLKLLLEEYIAKQERKWQKVMEKFRLSTDYPGLIYNNKMVEVMQDTMRYQDFRSQGGHKAKEQRVQRQTLLALEGAREDSTQDSTEHAGEHAVPSTRASSYYDDSLVVSSTSKKSKKLSTFDSTKFAVDNQMRDWFKGKYGELKEDDYQFLSEQFCNARKTYGAEAKSWRFSFYTFVNNYMADDRKHSLPSLRETGVNKNGNRYESTLEERERVTREHEEHLQRLRSGSHGDRSESSKALQLPPDFSNRSR